MRELRDESGHLYRVPPQVKCFEVRWMATAREEVGGRVNRPTAGRTKVGEGRIGQGPVGIECGGASRPESGQSGPVRAGE